jgi:5-methyltetrahydrofolate--homocysteine methyltransferase
MTQTILKKIAAGKILISDGAMGTELQKRGLVTGECPESLNVTHPDIVAKIHEDYYSAGSDLVETNSFGGNRFRLVRHNAADKVREYNRQAARVARQVCPAGKYVAGSIGPTGEMLEPFGLAPLDEAFSAFAEQAEALAEGGVDILFVETMIAIEEAVTAVKAAKKTGLPVAATMTFESADAGLRTSWGVDVPTALQQLIYAGADIVGTNCGNGMHITLAVIREMLPLSENPLLAQPNAGMPELNDNIVSYRETPSAMQPGYEELLKAGISIIGGCCGTTPEHIKMIHKLRAAIGR